MFKKVFFLVFLVFLKVSYELDYSTLSSPTFGGHYTNYNLKCLQFSTDEKCIEVEIDDDCQIKDDLTCEKIDAESKSYE